MSAPRPTPLSPTPGSGLLRSLLLCLALCATPALAQAQEDRALPAWEQLSAADREALIAPIRDRWNANPDQRARLMHHAKRWQAMTPGQRRDVRHGMKRWAHLDPEKRDRARVLFGEMRKMTRKEQQALRARWKAMTPAERDAWVEAHREAAERTR